MELYASDYNGPHKGKYRMKGLLKYYCCCILIIICLATIPAQQPSLQSVNVVEAPGTNIVLEERIRDVWMAVGNSTQGDKIDRYVALMKFNYTLDASAGVQGDKVTVDPEHQAGGTNNATAIANWSDTLGTLPALAPIFNPEWNKAFPTGNWPGP